MELLKLGDKVISTVIDQKRFIFYRFGKMHQKASAFGLPLKSLSALSLLGLDYQITPELRTLYDKATANDTSSLALLERDYVHHSHQPALPRGSVLWINPHKEESNSGKAAPNGIREIFYNNPNVY